MKNFLRKIFASLLAVALILSAFSFTSSFATDGPTFSIRRVSETDTEVVISVNLEKGSFNNAKFNVKPSENLTECKSIEKGDILNDYVVNYENVVAANNPAKYYSTIASTIALDKTGAYFLYTFTKANASRITASDFTFTEEDITCTVENDLPFKFGESALSISGTSTSGTITKCNTLAFGNAAISSTYSSKKIVAIGNRAFENCNDLDSLTIPNTVTSIGSNAFKNCTSIKTVTIAKSVKTIGADAFSGCTSIENVYFTGSLADWCSINFANAGANLNTIAKNLYINGKKISGDVVIPDSVTSIGTYAFINFSGITSVTLGKSITSIGKGAFSDCTGIAKVNYKSGSDDWKKITIGTGNEPLTKATFEYYYGHTHDYTVLVNKINPTCTTDGYSVYKCSMCDETCTSDIVKATDHSLGDWKYDKTYHWQICDNCKAKFNYAKHNFDANGGCACGYIVASMGDLNYDKAINSADALLTLKVTVGLIEFNSTQKALGDVDKDGKINSSDALKILQYTVGLIKSF